MSKTIEKQEPGLFDYQERMKKLSETLSPLEKLDTRIDWEIFRAQLAAGVTKESKGPGGRPRHDVVMMFKVLVLQRYYNLSEDQTEYQVNDRLSFQKFLGMTLADKVPDKNTIWDFKETLNRENGIEKLFARFEKQLQAAGLVGNAGKIIDASFVDVPRQRNNREENEIIKAGAVPIEFGKNEHKLSQKDTEARWTKKGKEVHYGYKNHIKANSQHKLIEDYVVTDASMHDSQVVADLVEEDDGSLHADSAYCGEKIDKILSEKKIENQVHERGYRNHPLTEEQKVSNHAKSKVRVRIEHIFGQMTQAMSDGLKLRSIGIKRITAAVGFLNLVYNMARYEQIMRLGLA